MLLKIKPEDIEMAERYKSNQCPMARALHRQCGRNGAYVGTHTWCWDMGPDDDPPMFQLPFDLQVQIAHYDAGGEWTLAEVEL